MKKSALVIAALVVFSVGAASLEVRRHDKPDLAYQPASEPGYLISMPHEGSGILVAPNWIATVAHNIFYDYQGKALNIGNQSYTMEGFVFHPDWHTQPEGLGTGDAAPLMKFLAGRVDLVLIKLDRSVEGREAVSLYKGNDEAGRMLTFYGRGAKGDGLTGEDFKTKQERRLGYFQNIADRADGGWIMFDFDTPDDALELEGTLGSGDSGGPSVIMEDGKPYAVGLNSWRYYEGDLADFKGGIYGQIAVQLRLSHYRKWILSVVNE